MYHKSRPFDFFGIKICSYHAGVEIHDSRSELPQADNYFHDVIGIQYSQLRPGLPRSNPT